MVMLIAFIGGEMRLQAGMHRREGFDERALIAELAGLAPAVEALLGMEGEGRQPLPGGQGGKRRTATCGESRPPEESRRAFESRRGRP